MSQNQNHDPVTLRNSTDWSFSSFRKRFSRFHFVLVKLTRLPLVDTAAKEAALVDRLCGLVVSGARTKGVTALVGSCTKRK